MISQPIKILRRRQNCSPPVLGRAHLARAQRHATFSHMEKSPTTLLGGTSKSFDTLLESPAATTDVAPTVTPTRFPHGLITCASTYCCYPFLVLLSYTSTEFENLSKPLLSLGFSQNLIFLLRLRISKAFTFTELEDLQKSHILLSLMIS